VSALYPDLQRSIPATYTWEKLCDNQRARGFRLLRERCERLESEWKMSGGSGDVSITISFPPQIIIIIIIIIYRPSPGRPIRIS